MMAVNPVLQSQFNLSYEQWPMETMATKAYESISLCFYILIIYSRLAARKVKNTKDVSI